MAYAMTRISENLLLFHLKIDERKQEEIENNTEDFPGLIYKTWQVMWFHSISQLQTLLSSEKSWNARAWRQLIRHCVSVSIQSTSIINNNVYFSLETSSISLSLALISE